MIHLDEDGVRAVLRWESLIAEMESALTAFSSGRVIQPVRSMITIEEEITRDASLKHTPVSRRRTQKRRSAEPTSS
jgi:hypothetical protein